MAITVAVCHRTGSPTFALCLERPALRGRPTARLRGALAATGSRSRATTRWRRRTADVLAFVDDDIAVGDGWLAALREAWNRAPEDRGCIGGPIGARFTGPRPRWLTDPLLGVLGVADGWQQLPRRQRLVPDRRAAGHRGVLARPWAPRASRLVLGGAPRPARAGRRRVEPCLRARRGSGADRRSRAAAPPRRARAPCPLRRAIGADRRASPAGGRGADRGIERGRRRGRHRGGRRRARDRARRTRRRERSRPRGSAHRSPRPPAHRRADAVPPLGPRRRSPSSPEGACAAPRTRRGRPGLPPRRRRARLRDARELRRPDRRPAQPVHAGAAGRHRPRRRAAPTPSRSPSTTATPKPCATRCPC